MHRPIKHVALLALTLLFAGGAGCGAAASSGGECSVGADCASGACQAGRCVAGSGGTGGGPGGSGGAAGAAGQPSDAGTGGTSGSGGSAGTGSGGTAGSGASGGSAGTGGCTTACCPNQDGVIERKEVPLMAGLSAKFEAAENAPVDTAGTTAAGGSRTWDLSGALPGDHLALVATQSLKGTWYENNYPGASYASKLSDTASLLGVFQITNNALLLVGVVSPNNGVTRTQLKYSPPVTVISFPLKMGKTWTTTFERDRPRPGARRQLHGEVREQGRRERDDEDALRGLPRAAHAGRAHAHGGAADDRRAHVSIHDRVLRHHRVDRIQGQREQRGVHDCGRGAEADAMRRALWLPLFIVLLATGCMPAFHRGAMPGEPKHATFAQVDGARVRYVDVGKGPAVVLLHGFASSLDTWDGVVPVLSKSHRVIALDLKGFGWTDRPPGDYSPRAEAKLVFDLLSQRGVDKVAVVAHSWGCAVALAMALAHPERVTRLALYDAWVYEQQLPSTFQWARADGLGEVLFDLYYKQLPGEKMSAAFYDQRYVTQQLVDQVKAALDRPGTTAAALAAVRGQRFYAVQGRYKKIAQPVLLLWGRDDRVAPIQVANRLLRDLPDSKLIVYPRCGHFPMIEAASASTRDLAHFIGEGATASAAADAAPAPSRPVPPPAAPAPTATPPAAAPPATQPPSGLPATKFPESGS